jgi:hypothetical protein
MEFKAEESRGFFARKIDANLDDFLHFIGRVEEAFDGVAAFDDEVGLAFAGCEEGFPIHGTSEQLSLIEGAPEGQWEFGLWSWADIAGFDDLGPREVFAQHVGEELVCLGKSGSLCEAVVAGEAAEEGMFDARARDCFHAVAGGLVGGPKFDVLFCVAEVDDEVSALAFSNGIGPPDFQEVAGFRVGKGSEIDATVEFGEEFGRSWSVGIPAAEDILAVLHADPGVTLELFPGEGEGVVCSHFFHGPEEDHVGRARAKGGL